MDSSSPAVIEAVPVSKPVPSSNRQHRSAELKRKIVEETLAPGASVARVARAHGVNANQVFEWRRLYREGRLGAPIATA
jgi:transposase